VEDERRRYEKLLRLFGRSLPRATSERNAALYARLGFEHLGAFTALDSPPLRPMRRPQA
jgi:hypothetical protein